MCLQAYDQHLNMILGEVEEVITTVELDEETFEEMYKVRTVHTHTTNSYQHRYCWLG